MNKTKHRQMKQINKAAVLCAALMGIVMAGSACCGKKAGTAQSAVESKTIESRVVDGEWLVRRLKGKTLPKEVQMDLIIKQAEGKIAGRAACNRYFGEVTGLSEGKVQFGSIGSTRMACPEMEYEAAFFEALRATKAYGFADDGALLLSDEAGAVVLELSRKAEGETTADARLHDIWVATHIGSDAVDKEDVPTLEINLTEMTCSGYDGCNSYMGSIKQATASALTLGDMAGTLRMCHDMATPDKYSQALHAVRTYRLDGLTLHLYDAEGKEVLTFKKAD